MIKYIFSKIVKWQEIARLHREAIQHEMKAGHILVRKQQIADEVKRNELEIKDTEFEMKQIEESPDHHKVENRDKVKQLKAEIEDIKKATEIIKKSGVEIQLLAQQRKQLAIQLRGEADWINKNF